MSEKLYALRWRCHAAGFRDAYADEALRLFRDRVRDETGWFARLRLWIDLFADLAVSVPRGYLRSQPDFVSASGPLHLQGLPSFLLLGSGWPRRRALLIGGVVSLGALLVFPAFIGQARDNRPTRAPVFDLAAPTMDQAPAAQGGFDAAERQRVIHGAIANMKVHYPDAAVAQKVADALAEHERNGDYEMITDARGFADLLTRHLREASQDIHLDVAYSQSPLPDRPLGPTPEGAARYRKAMEQANCTFEKVEILPHNIGYLKFNSFPDPSVCEPAAKTAMASMNRANAVIFDLRDNGGGYAGMVMLLAAYLFDHPVYLYNPRENTTAQSWTRSPVPESILSDKPVYLLTSGHTASAAEQFSYNLKMLKRATLVGETTRGTAHSGVFRRIDDHFGMGIPETKAINPYSTRDWEGTGVVPDVQVNAEAALERARTLAESRLAKH